MLNLAVWLLAAGVALGATAAVLWLRHTGAAPLPLAATHAIVAVAGFAALLLALPASAGRGAASGTASFGVVAAWLVGLALLAALGMLVLRALARRVPGALVGVHASLAVAGFVIAAVYALLP